MPNRSLSRCVLLAFAGAVLATLLASAVLPDRTISATSALARAIAYITVVFGTAAVATYLGLLVGGGQATRTRKVALRTAATTLWLPPLLLFSQQGSWFVLVIWAVLLVEVTRLLAFLRRMFHDDAVESSQASPDAQMFPVLNQDFPSGLSIVGALLVQGAIFGALDGRNVLASLLYLCGTATLAYRILQMFQDSPTLKERTWTRRIPPAFLTATLLVAFAWLPHIVGLGGLGAGEGSLAGTGSRQSSTPGSGTGGRKQQRSAPGASSSLLARLRSLFDPARSEFRGDSFAAAKNMFDSRFPHEPGAASTGTPSRQNTNIPISVLVAGPVFPGVELYPAVDPQKKLVMPPVAASTGFGHASTDPLSIPFDGVYWFWRGPFDQPPLNSVVMHGSPSAQFFRSTDGDGMSMEARQNLGFMVDPKRFSAIEVSVENSDPFPNSVKILLKIRNTALPGKPILSLGMENVASPTFIARTRVRRQTLRFRIPGAIAMGSFDELTLSYFLVGARSNRSARIAVEGFRLVPRGG